MDALGRIEKQTTETHAMVIRINEVLQGDKYGNKGYGDRISDLEENHKAHQPVIAAFEERNKKFKKIQWISISCLISSIFVLGTTLVVHIANKNVPSAQQISQPTIKISNNK